MVTTRGAIPDYGRGPEISFDVGPHRYTVISVDKDVRSSESDGKTEVESRLHLIKVRKSDKVTVADVRMRSSARLGADERDNEYLHGSVNAVVEKEPPLEGTDALFKANMVFSDILVGN